MSDETKQSKADLYVAPDNVPLGRRWFIYAPNRVVIGGPFQSEAKALEAVELIRETYRLAEVEDAEAAKSAGNAFEDWCYEHFGTTAHQARFEKRNKPLIMGDILAAFHAGWKARNAEQLENHVGLLSQVILDFAAVYGLADPVEMGRFEEMREAAYRARESRNELSPAQAMGQGASQVEPGASYTGDVAAVTASREESRLRSSERLGSEPAAASPATTAAKPYCPHCGTQFTFYDCGGCKALVEIGDAARAANAVDDDGNPIQYSVSNTARTDTSAREYGNRAALEYAQGKVPPLTQGAFEEVARFARKAFEAGAQSRPDQKDTLQERLLNSPNLMSRLAGERLQTMGEQLDAREKEKLQTEYLKMLGEADRLRTLFGEIAFETKVRYSCLDRYGEVFGLIERICAEALQGEGK